MAERTVDVYVAMGNDNVRAGRLYAHRGRAQESTSFAYTDSYLSRVGAYPLDPSLPLSSGVFHSAPGRTLFGAFSDCAPDRWGRRLVSRAERHRAKREGVTPRITRQPDSVGSRRIDDRDGVDFEQVLRPGQRGDPHQSVGRLVVAEQRGPALLDLREVFPLVTGDEDRQLRHLIGTGARRGERVPDVGEHLVSLGRHVAGPDDVSLPVLGHLARDEDHPRAGGDDDVAVGRRRVDLLGINGFQCHRSAFCS